VAYHLGILVKAGGDASQTDGLQFLCSSLQFALNAGVMWRFFSCVFKDMLLDTIKSKVADAKDKFAAEDEVRKEVVHGRGLHSSTFSVQSKRFLSNRGAFMDYFSGV
jgi:hypothetical protein